MPKKLLVILVLSLIIFISGGIANASKISVFNFGTANLEASGLGTTVTNLLTKVLKNDPSIFLLDRKDLEAFLNFNDLQQNDQLDNVINIGAQLDLDFIIVGSVDKRGSAIYVNCNLVQINKKKEVYSERVKAYGESALSAEVVKLGSLIIEAVKKNNAAAGPSSNDKFYPADFQKISGNKKIILRWRETPGFADAGFEVYRALNSAGPYAMIGQTEKFEYSDQGVDNGNTYYYKIRSFDKMGQLSNFTQILSASTDFAPNPPIIIKTEGFAKSILIVCAANPLKSEDTSQLAGFRVYRAKAEDGPYQEIARLQLVKNNSEESEEKISYRDKSLPDGTDFYYRLTAFNEKGIESELSHPLKGTAIGKIASVNAQNDLIREVKLNWTGLQSPFIVAYNIYRSLKNNADFKKIKKINSADLKDNFVYADLDGLGDKTNYFYYITAEDVLGIETSPSPVAQAATRGVPPQTVNFTARNGLVKKVELSWTAAKQEEVEGYKVYWAPEKDGRYTLLKKINGRENNFYLDDSHNPDPLLDKKTYYYKLTAFNKVDAESLPVQASATTKSRPQKPSGLKGEASKIKEASLAWKANLEKDITGYQIYRSSDEKDDFSEVARVDKTSYIDKGLKDGVSRRYKIRAEDKDGLVSDFSEAIVVSTKARPKAPEGLSGTYESGNIKISWKPNKEEDISQYSIYVKQFFGLEKLTSVTSANYTDSTIVKGATKIYIIKAVDRDGLESDPSAELTVAAK